MNDQNIPEEKPLPKWGLVVLTPRRVSFWILISSIFAIYKLIFLLREGIEMGFNFIGFIGSVGFLTLLLIYKYIPRNKIAKKISIFVNIWLVIIIVSLSLFALFQYQKLSEEEQGILIPAGVEKIEIPEKEVSVGIPSSVEPTTAWDCANIEGCLEKWHGCKNLDCIFDIMEQYGASSDTINFTKFLMDVALETGYLGEFQEKGKIDLGIVSFPGRANTNDVYYLLNGFPALVPTEISPAQIRYNLNGGTELENEIKQDLLYSEMKEKYPDIWFRGEGPQFTEKKVLSNGNERFIFTYRFINGCRVCTTEYSAKIGFDFDSDGKFLKIIFLQIVK